MPLETWKLGYHRSMMVNHHITVDSGSYEKVETFKYLDSLLLSQNYIHVEIKRRIKTENS